MGHTVKVNQNLTLPHPSHPDYRNNEMVWRNDVQQKFREENLDNDDFSYIFPMDMEDRQM